MIYSLDIDYPHISEENPYDAELIEFPGYWNVPFENPKVDAYARGAPAVIEFVADLKNVSRLDHLETAPSRYLLVSKKMVQVLESVRPFRCQLFPARIYAREIRNLVRDEHSRERTSYRVSDPTLYTDDFVILKVSDTLDGLDRERTLIGGVPFLQSGEEYIGNYPLRGSHIALREPEGGFSPVFYVPGLLFYCYSEEAKQACERAGLKGLCFNPLP